MSDEKDKCITPSINEINQNCVNDFNGLYNKGQVNVIYHMKMFQLLVKSVNQNGAEIEMFFDGLKD